MLALRSVFGSSALLLGVVACGGTAAETSSSSTFDGQVTGKTLAVQDAVTVRFVRAGAPFGLLVFLSNAANACEPLKHIADWKDALMEPKDPIVPAAKSFWMLMIRGNPDQAGETVIPGDYQSPASFGAGASSVIANFQETDAACHFLANQSSTSGSAHLDTIGADGRATGTFQIVMGAQADRVSGSFDAAPCAELEFTNSGARPPGCP